MRPKTDILTLTRFAIRDRKLVKGLDDALMGKNPYQIDGHYWLVSNREQTHQDKFEYTLTKPCKTLDEWELEHKPCPEIDSPRGIISKATINPKRDVIYIAGAISGDVIANRHKFAAAKHNILASSTNAAVLNPAELPDGLTQAQYMSICLPMVMTADTVYMLVGWEKSKGAVAEHALAEKLCINIEYQRQPGE